MIVSITGHRPERIPDMKIVAQALFDAYDALEATRIIQGCAAGVDLTSAFVAYRKRIPFSAYRPWKGHAPRVCDRTMYGQMMKFANEVIDVDPSLDYPGPWVYQKRNVAMVDRAEATIAVWDGVKKGGTFNCVKYAWEKNVPVLVIDPKTGKFDASA
jgi:uncharacterized phage-like protein YoqJ